jgi:hypothetical protein
MSQTSREAIAPSSENDGVAMIGSNLLHQEQALDEALMDSFPASDPVAISFGYVLRRKLPTTQASEC